MKNNLLIIFIVSALCLTFVGCGQGESTTNSPVQSTLQANKYVTEPASTDQSNTTPIQEDPLP